MAKQVSLFTLGESTSLPEYDAHRLLASTCFVLGIDPDDPDEEAVCAVVEQGAEAVFARNLAYLEAETRRAGELWKETCLAVPLLESIALKDTLESLRAFPARYQPRFFAHEIPADIDYPLSCPVPESTKGVNYVTAYLEQLKAECLFMQVFDRARCHAVLRAVHPQYGELILNLFEPVVATAVGCALAGCSVRNLTLSDDDRARIKSLLREASPRHMKNFLDEAALTACDQLGFHAAPANSPDVTNNRIRNAVRQVAINLIPRLRAALHHDTLNGVFPS
ncbi:MULTISPECIES: DUF6179 domain-containing protein [Gordonibacter]|uniref:DUF6179 domain-containing protein n=1 Tax=Gordonibacter faecis TaxID=3047475 RepID=A0ABT7DNI3_9ACTN|nr:MULTISPECIES: DUF6179 domain-containing protein [unclassified Gordonibacter]MDJ1650118.1 DUF6179 domain-containing protein [Gordonibacter sp. KGMB12511]HIW75562.1 hypothetical protein [Candidatus Gordonibacter avicola]